MANIKISIVDPIFIINSIMCLLLTRHPWLGKEEPSISFKVFIRGKSCFNKSFLKIYFTAIKDIFRVLCTCVFLRTYVFRLEVSKPKPHVWHFSLFLNMWEHKWILMHSYFNCKLDNFSIIRNFEYTIISDYNWL